MVPSFDNAWAAPRRPINPAMASYAALRVIIYQVE